MECYIICDEGLLLTGQTIKVSNLDTFSSKSAEDDYDLLSFKL